MALPLRAARCGWVGHPERSVRRIVEFHIFAEPTLSAMRLRTRVGTWCGARKRKGSHEATHCLFRL